MWKWIKWILRSIRIDHDAITVYRANRLLKGALLLMQKKIGWWENNLSCGGGIVLRSYPGWDMKVFHFRNRIISPRTPFRIHLKYFYLCSKFLKLFLNFKFFGKPLFLKQTILDFDLLTKYFTGVWCSAVVGRSHWCVQLW